MSLAEYVADAEVVLRHVPGGTFWQAPGPRVTSKNFEPRADEQGVSVSRAGITTAAALMARVGSPTTGSKIAAATVGDIRAMGLDVVAVPIDDDPGHAEIWPATTALHGKTVYRQLAKLFQFVS